MVSIQCLFRSDEFLNNKLLYGMTSSGSIDGKKAVDRYDINIDQMKIKTNDDYDIQEMPSDTLNSSGDIQNPINGENIHLMPELSDFDSQVLIRTFCTLEDI